MVKLFSLRLLVCWILFFIFPSQTFAATFSLDPSEGTFKKGCTYPVNINLDSQGVNTDGADAILFYDPNIFSITTSSIINGSIYPEFPGNSVNQINGQISISGISSVSTPFNGQGLFATINLKVKDDAVSGSTPVTFDFDPANPTKTTDSNIVERGTIVDVLSSVTDGNYIISDESCITPPSDSDADGWTDDQEIFLGTDSNDACPDNRRDNAWPPDLNNDKRVNNGDFVLLNRIIKRNKPYVKRYDLNLDNKLDSADLGIITQNLGKKCKN